MKIKAFAKINLSLRVLGKRSDNYHEIESLMQSISLHDLVTIEQIPFGIELSVSDSRLPVDEKNLAYRAAQLMLKNQPWGVKITIEKKIPIAAGLAGGSADAAAVLFGLNQMMKDDACLPAGRGRRTMDELITLGAQIGSDVPFCLIGGNCTVKGRGEKVTRNQLTVKRSYVLVVPDIEVSTRWAYSSFDEKFQIPNPNPQTNSNIQILKSQNDLEAVVVEKYPVIREIKEKLLKLGCRSAQMSGSGPAVFGLVNNADQGEKIVSKIKDEFPRSYFVETVEKGLELQPSSVDVNDTSFSQREKDSC